MNYYGIEYIFRGIVLDVAKFLRFGTPFHKAGSGKPLGITKKIKSALEKQKTETNLSKRIPKTFNFF